MARGIPISHDTREAVQAAIAACGSLRACARRYNLSPALLSDIAAGHDEDVSIRAENRARAVFGLPPIPPRRPAACCPDCLREGIEVVHGDGLRCYGKRNGHAVVLAEDEKIIRRRRCASPRAPTPRARGPRLEVRGLDDDCARWWRALTPRARGRMLSDWYENQKENADQATRDAQSTAQILDGDEAGPLVAVGQI